MNIDEMRKQADPLRAELAEKQKEVSDKLDKLIELQEECNVVFYEMNNVMKCIKQGHKKRHSAGIKISIATAVVIIVVAVVESLTKGEASWVMGMLNVIKGIMP